MFETVRGRKINPKMDDNIPQLTVVHEQDYEKVLLIDKEKE